MNAPLLASLLSRCLAIWLFLIALNTGSAAVQTYLLGPSGREWVAWSAAVAAALFVAAAWAWAEAPQAARLLVRGLPDADDAMNVDRDAVELLVFTGVGLFVLAEAIPSIAHWGARLYLLRDEPFSPGGRLTRPLELATLLGELVRLGVGLLLVFRANGLRRWIATLRGLKSGESA